MENKDHTKTQSKKNATDENLMNNDNNQHESKTSLNKNEGKTDTNHITQSNSITSDTLYNIQEIITKTSVVFVAFLYTSGLIVHNYFLSKYGFFSLSLAQANYIFAGFWSVLPIIIVSTVIIYVGQKYNELKRIWRILIDVFYIGCIYFMLYLFNITAKLEIKEGFWFSPIFAIIFAPFYLSPFRAIISPSTQKYVNHRKVDSILLIGGIFSLLFYIVVFGSIVYQDIPHGLGGGQPRTAFFVVDKKHEHFLKNVGVSVDSQTGKTENVRVILVTDKEFVFLPANSVNSISVRKDLVKIAVYKNQIEKWVKDK